MLLLRRNSTNYLFMRAGEIWDRYGRWKGCYKGPCKTQGSCPQDGDWAWQPSNLLQLWRRWCCSTCTYSIPLYIELDCLWTPFRNCTNFHRSKRQWIRSFPLQLIILDWVEAICLIVVLLSHQIVVSSLTCERKKVRSFWLVISFKRAMVKQARWELIG